jgi:membrane associated rhomboid family serine protease
MDTNALKRDIIKSDMMRIFIAALSIFTLLLVVKIYFFLNGDRPKEWMDSFYPYITITKNPLDNIKHPWVLLTHIFVERDIFALFSNFLWLWLFGIIVENLRGQNRVFPLFIISGLICGISVLVLTAISTGNMKMDYYYGMRNSILAVGACAVFLNPDYRVFERISGGIKLWILGLIFLAMDITTRGGIDMVNIVTILIAVGIGYFFTKGLGDFFQDSLVAFYNWVDSRNTVTQATPTKNSYKVVDISEHKLNEILDRINKDGIKSLSNTDREWLKSYNERNESGNSK